MKIGNKIVCKKNIYEYEYYMFAPKKFSDHFKYFFARIFSSLLAPHLYKLEYKKGQEYQIKNIIGKMIMIDNSWFDYKDLNEHFYCTKKELRKAKLQKIQQ